MNRFKRSIYRYSFGIDSMILEKMWRCPSATEVMLKNMDKIVRYQTKTKYNKARTLQWRYNGRNDVSNHQPHHCLLNHLFSGRQRKHQSSASQVFVRGIHQWQVNSLHKGPVARKMIPFDDVIRNRMHILWDVLYMSVAISACTLHIYEWQMSQYQIAILK